MLNSESKIFARCADDGRLILNSSQHLSDIYLNSGLDGRCFRAHRLVLAAATHFLEKILNTSCLFCGGEPDDNTVLTFADVSGTVLENFLSLCYTGSSLRLKDNTEEVALKYFCMKLGLKDFDSLFREEPSFICDISSVRTILSDDVTVGYSECDNLKSLLSNDVLKLGTVCPDIDGHHFDDLISADFGHLNGQVENVDFFQTDTGVKMENSEGEQAVNNEDDENYDYEGDIFEPDFSNLPVTRSTRSGSGLKANWDRDKNRCISCQKVFRSKVTYERHVDRCLDLIEATNERKLKKLRNEEKPAQINYKFEKRAGLFLCLHSDCTTNIDSQSFDTKKNLVEHWNEQHATDEEKAFQCSFCELRFASSYLRDAHESSKHVLAFESSSFRDKPVSSKPVSPYQCNVCCKKFFKKNSLVAHMRKHPVGDKQLTCSTCGTIFASTIDLQTHTDLHHPPNTSLNNLDNLKYCCNDCGKSFSRKSILNQHMAKHQKTTPETCEPLSDLSEDPASIESVLSPPKINFLFSKDEEGRFQCLHQDCQSKVYTFQWKNGFQDHWLDKHATEKEKVYRCSYCNKGFASNGLRNKHIKFNHELQYTCSQCNKKFPTRHTLMSHTRMHTGEKPFVCHLCGADFRNRTNWRQHNEQYHAEVKKHKCDECGKLFRLRATLKEHQIKHQLTKQFNVDFPLDVVENDEGKQAMYYVPKTDYPMREENGRFFCTHEDCLDKPLSFQWKNGLREHYMERHALDDEKHFGCNFCSKKFGTNALRNKHEKITHLLRFPCVHCDKKFGKRVTLVHHMRLHTGEKPFVCEICGTRFSQKTYLKQHNDLHHPKEEIKKEHKCDTCGKFFRLKGQLKHHIKTTHIEGRPYVCEECGKNYKDIGTLKRHKESHSLIRIACEPCNLTFPSRANLRRHIRRKHEKKIILLKPELIVA